MIIDCISDLHGNYPTLTGGDLLIVAGDLTARDTEYEYADKFLPWLIDQHFTKYKKVIWIGGNHDNWVEKNISKQNQFSGGEYLCDSGTEFEGLKIWGSPWTKTFPGMNPYCMAFTCHTEEELAKKWALIPDDTEILITHSPPYGVLDQVIKVRFPFNMEGSKSLEMRVHLLPKLRLHIFGHIHESYGERFEMDTHFVNSSHVNERYQPLNKPIRVIF